MKLAISLGFGGDKNMVLPVKRVQRAEELGFDSVWSGETYGSDAMSPLAYLAGQTQRIRLGTGIAQLAARSPANMAMTAQTIDALAGGHRMIIGLGVSGPQIVEGWYGQPWGKPNTRIRDYVAVVKKILKREGPVVALGLYREMFNLANRYGITHCYAAMEPALARLLNRLGFPFHEAGPLNTNVTPARQPYLIGAYAARAGLAARNSCLYRFMFGGEDAGPQVMTTSAAWRVAAEPRPHRGLGLHI